MKNKKITRWNELAIFMLDANLDCDLKSYKQIEKFKHIYREKRDHSIITVFRWFDDPRTVWKKIKELNKDNPEKQYEIIGKSSGNSICRGNFHATVIVAEQKISTLRKSENISPELVNKFYYQLISTGLTGFTDIVNIITCDAWCNKNLRKWEKFEFAKNIYIKMNLPLTFLDKYNTYKEAVSTYF